MESVRAQVGNHFDRDQERLRDTYQAISRIDTKLQEVLATRPGGTDDVAALKRELEDKNRALAALELGLADLDKEIQALRDRLGRDGADAEADRQLEIDLTAKNLRLQDANAQLAAIKALGDRLLAAMTAQADGDEFKSLVGQRQLAETALAAARTIADDNLARQVALNRVWAKVADATFNTLMIEGAEGQRFEREVVAYFEKEFGYATQSVPAHQDGYYKCTNATEPGAPQCSIPWLRGARTDIGHVSFEPHYQAMIWEGGGGRAFTVDYDDAYNLWVAKSQMEDADYDTVVFDGGGSLFHGFSMNGYTCGDRAFDVTQCRKTIACTCVYDENHWWD
jgi:hypothetical protein